MPPSLTDATCPTGYTCREDELGSVTVGKLADLLVVNGDPSIDIAVLQNRDNLNAIVKGGEFVKDVL